MRQLLGLLVACLHEAASGDQGILNGLLQKALGNPFCFDGRSHTFHACCGGPGGHRGCWDSGAFSYEACCYSAGITWVASGAEASSRLAAYASPWGVNSPGKRGAECLAQAPALQRFSSRLLRGEGSGGTALRSGSLDAVGCGRLAGRGYNTTVYYFTDREKGQFGHTRLRLRLCAPLACSPEDVATVVAPLHFLDQAFGLGALTMVAWVDVASADGLGGDPRQRAGYVGSRTPPADATALAAYRRMFWVCGDCELVRYGGAHDGGYLMCPIGGGDLPYAGVYSYGIDGRDTWGASLSAATGSAVYRYDCIGEDAECEAPCKAVFHRECLSAHTQPEDDLHHATGTLPEHLAANGHLDAAEGSLLLKADVEGEEWAVFAGLEQRVLRKFRQISLELHEPCLDGLTDAVRLAQLTAMMENLLQSFVVVHVHSNNYCHKPDERLGREAAVCGCVEVTFAHRAFVQPGVCRAPSRAALDEPNEPLWPDDDIAELFRAGE